MNTLESRSRALAALGATSTEIEELLRYTENKFDHTQITEPLRWPLADEPFVAAWEGYAAEAQRDGVFATLKRKLIPFRFPVEEGISQSEAYRAATRRGLLPPADKAGPGLELRSPEALELQVHPTAAGRLPLLIVHHRDDFVALVRALTLQNEPRLVPASMGACMVAGFNNWDRIFSLRARWEAAHPGATEEDWNEEFGRIIPQKESYQDRFMILSDGPYSSVSAQDMGLAEQEWSRLSMIIRREHEGAHYLTRRVLKSMRNNLIDEIIADYCGIRAAAGVFRADWFLRFMGLESFPRYRAGARLENYRGDPPLSDRAFRVLQILVKRAAENLERFDRVRAGPSPEDRQEPNRLIALSRLGLDELASPHTDLLLSVLRDGTGDALAKLTRSNIRFD
ncbi:MAG: DUF7005 family protein [Limisphaerales bacterium]